MQKIADGDELSFRILFNRYWDRLYIYLLRITKSHELAEEIASDVFLKLWTGREILPYIQNFDGFMFKVAYNRTIDFFRVANRNKKLQELISNQVIPITVSGTDYPLLSSESNKILIDIINQLSPQRRIVFTLSRIDGLSHDEIAKKLNLSKQTVKNTLSAAIASVQKILIKKFPDSYSFVFIILNL